MKRITLFITIPLLLLASCKESEEIKETPIRPVKYETVGSGESDLIRTFSAIVQAGDQVDLSFRSSGIITELNFVVGDYVNKGDLLARLDNIQSNLALQQSITNVNSAQSSLNTSKSNLDRIKVLYEKGSKSLSDYENAKNAYENAQAQFESALQNKKIQQTQVSYGFIYAPSRGIIVQKISELNENVQAGQVIGVLNAGNDINVIVGLPEGVINKVKLGMKASITFSALTDTIVGTVFEISPVAETNSSTYPVKLEFEKGNENIRPGMASNVTFQFSDDKPSSGHPIIPVKAVGEDGEGNFVFIVETDKDNNSFVRKTYIEIGELTADGFSVLSGIKNGQRIATAGLQTLLDNQQVRLTK